MLMKHLDYKDKISQLTDVTINDSVCKIVNQIYKSHYFGYNEETNALTKNILYNFYKSNGFTFIPSLTKQQQAAQPEDGAE